MQWEGPRKGPVVPKSSGVAGDLSCSAGDFVPGKLWAAAVRGKRGVETATEASSLGGDGQGGVSALFFLLPGSGKP